MASRLTMRISAATSAVCATMLCGGAAMAQLTRGVRIMNPPVEAAPIAAPTPDPNPKVADKKPGAAPIRIAASDGLAARFNGVAPLESQFEVVQPPQQPDFVWDPASREVTASGDVIAHEINSSDLPQVVDRMAAVRAIKQLSAQAPLQMKLVPDLKVHSRDTTVELIIDDVQGRALFAHCLEGRFEFGHGLGGADGDELVRPVG